MNDSRRAGDHPSKSVFRGGDRLFQDGGEWYFYTREDCIKGPFPTKIEATAQLVNYIKWKSLSPGGDWSLVPKEGN